MGRIAYGDSRTNGLRSTKLLVCLTQGVSQNRSYTGCVGRMTVLEIICLDKFTAIVAYVTLGHTLLPELKFLSLELSIMVSMEPVFSSVTVHLV